MGTRAHLRCRRRRTATLQLTLLILPALFWSAVFAALAGFEPVERVASLVSDAGQLVIAVGCPLLFSMLSVQSLRGGANASSRGRMRVADRIAFAVGASLFVIAVLAAIGTG
jgi:hypothetical protein